MNMLLSLQAQCQHGTYYYCQIQQGRLYPNILCSQNLNCQMKISYNEPTKLNIKCST